MRIYFAGSLRGKRLYSVFADQSNCFTGTLSECKRYILIHNEKVIHRREMVEAARRAAS